jgi:hypothetical protein
MKKLLLIFCIALSLISHTLYAKKLATLSQRYNLDKGFVGIIYDKSADKIYFKIDKLNQAFLYTTSLASGVGQKKLGLDRGQTSNPRVVVFERAGNRVFLKQVNQNYRADGKHEFEGSFSASVIWSFPVADSRSSWVLVDASDFIYQDIHGVANKLNQYGQHDYIVDASRSAVDMPRTTAFADNTEIEATVTFVSSAPLSKKVSVNPKAITLKLHHSFIRMPAAGFEPRQYLPKSNYYSITHQSYDQLLNANLKKRFILRHRLSKQKPSANVSEPVKPIIFYIKPGMPDLVKSAVTDGVMWWDQAFNELGYKGAIQVKDLPAKADSMDIRYNTIQWLYSDEPSYSYNQRVIDPRTGEIINSRITLDALAFRQSYLTAQGMLANFVKADNKAKVFTDFALAQLRQTVAHEVGHALGINHNTGDSSYLKNSVINATYVLFDVKDNRVFMPNNFHQGIKPWDKVAIAYGYASFSSDNKNLELRQLIDKADKYRLTGELADSVARLNKANQARRIALNSLGPNNMLEGEDWSNLNSLLLPVYLSHKYYINPVVRLIGGVEYEYSNNPKQLVYKTVSSEKQNQAFYSLLKTLSPEFLSLPNFLVNLLFVSKIIQVIQNE